MEPVAITPSKADLESARLAPSSWRTWNIFLALNYKSRAESNLQSQTERQRHHHHHRGRSPAGRSWSSFFRSGKGNLQVACKVDSPYIPTSYVKDTERKWTLSLAWRLDQLTSALMAIYQHQKTRSFSWNFDFLRIFCPCRKSSMPCKSRQHRRLCTLHGIVQRNHLQNCQLTFNWRSSQVTTWPRSKCTHNLSSIIVFFTKVLRSGQQVSDGERPDSLMTS